MDCIVKMVDANKDKEGTEALVNESSMYEAAGDLCGDVVFSGRLSLGRAGLILSYEGKSIDQVQEFKTKQTYEKAKQALETIHCSDLIHGDIALRNIVAELTVISS